MKPPIPPQYQALVLAVKDELKRVQQETNPRFKVTTPGYIRLAVQAQNVLRLCLEAVLEDLTPFDEPLLGELAVRLASYVVSAAPMDHQEALIETVAANLPKAHSTRVSQGIVISTVWERR